MVGMDLEPVASDGSSCFIPLPICNGVGVNNIWTFSFQHHTSTLVIIYILLYVTICTELNMIFW